MYEASSRDCIKSYVFVGMGTVMGFYGLITVGHLREYKEMFRLTGVSLDMDPRANPLWPWSALHPLTRRVCDFHTQATASDSRGMKPTHPHSWIF